MNETNHFKIGLFICGATSIFILLLFSVGLRGYFESPFRIHTYTSNSVQGLEVGSAVKYQGVSIGKVDEILVVKKNYVEIDMSIRPTLMMKSIKKKGENYKYLTAAQTDEEIYDRIKKNVDLGLRCKIEYAGITGMKYVELYYSKDPIEVVSMEVDEVGYIPATQSSLAGTVGSMQDVLQKIASVDFVGIEKDLRKMLVSIDALASNKELEHAIIAFAQALDEIKAASSEIRSEVSTSGIELKKTLRSTRLLLEMLEEDPGSIISGKQKQR